MPSSCPMSRTDRPSAFIAATRSRLTTSRGLPPMRPAFRARCNPALVRSTMSSRSNSAIAARMFSNSLLAGLLVSVSIPCVMAMNRTPSESSSWTEATKCGIDRPHRSIFQTAMASILRCLASAINRVRAGRLSFVPLIVDVLAGDRPLSSRGVLAERSQLLGAVLILSGNPGVNR